VSEIVAAFCADGKQDMCCHNCAALVGGRRRVRGAHVSIPFRRHLCANACCCGAFAPEDVGGIILRRALLGSCSISSLRYCGGRGPIYVGVDVMVTPYERSLV